MLLHLWVFIRHFHRPVRPIRISLELRMESIVLKRVFVVVLILLYTLMWWIRLDEFSNFLLKLSFLFVYISCFDISLWSLWSLDLAHRVAIWYVILVACPWWWGMIGLSKLIDPIFLKDGKFEHLIFEIVLFVLIIITHLRYNT